ncbi:hypothetical protein E2542_SST20550 [Spatholobus suberectus]|nr:hypothetical protein E2542_SST20550 [Spatholobus suberectus]
MRKARSLLMTSTRPPRYAPQPPLTPAALVNVREGHCSRVYTTVRTRFDLPESDADVISVWSLGVRFYRDGSDLYA